MDNLFLLCFTFTNFATNSVLMRISEQLLGVIFANMLAKSIRQLKTEQEMRRQETRQRLYAEVLRGNNEKPSPVIFPTPTESEA